MLCLSPANINKPTDELRLFISGSLLERKLVFRSPIKLYVSPNNSGAAEVANEMTSAFGNINVQAEAPHTRRSTRRPGSIFVRLRASSLISSFKLIAKPQTALNRITAAAGARSTKINISLTKQFSTGEYFLVYLNEQTFQGDAGEALAGDIANALQSNVNVVLVHEKDPERHACSFDVIIQM